MNKEIILNHELVPVHEVLGKEEAQLILKKFGVKKEQLPKISEKDPVVKAINAKKGDIIRIKRKSPFIGESYYYRVVV